MNEIILKEINGEVLVSSRDVAEDFEKEHRNVMRDIRNIVGELGGAQNCAHLFTETTYVHEQNNQTYSEYLMTKDGFVLLAMGFTGKIALGFKMRYIEAFNKMKAHIEEQNTRMLPTTYKEALLQLIEQIEENEVLLAENAELTDGIDRYQRFLCEKTGCLKKSELAKKLDASAQRLAAVLKRVGVYTPSSQVKQTFLDQYPNLKLIVDVTLEYKDYYGRMRSDSGWAWTHDGAKAVVDYLIDKEMVVFTDNDGFKLKAIEE